MSWGWTRTVTFSEKDDKQQRLIELLKYLEQQIQVVDLAQKQAAVVAYINRFGMVTSEASYRRWKLKEQFPWKSRRPLLANAIGCSPEQLEGFLNEGTPNSAELFLLLPPIPPEFSLTGKQASIDLSSEAAIVNSIVFLFDYLSLNSLGKVLNLLKNHIIAQVKIYGLDFITAGNQFSLNGEEGLPLAGFSGIRIADLLKGKNLQQISELVDLPLARLQSIAAGSEPLNQELTLLAAALEIPIHKLEEIRRREFDNRLYFSKDCHQNC